MENFQHLCKVIGINVQKILYNVSSMQRILVNLGTSKDNQSREAQLQHIEKYTKQLAQETSRHMKLLNDIYDQVKCSSSVPAFELKQWGLQRDRLTNDFIKALNGYKALQQSIAEREKDILKKTSTKQGRINGVPKEETPLVYLKHSNQTGNQKIHKQIQEEDYNIEQLEERENAIRQLESDIVDVNTIFKDLATMVHEQGEIVDSIEANVESTTVRVHEGTDQLRQAETYRNKARKKKLILSVVGVTLLVIIIAIIAWQAN